MKRRKSDIGRHTRIAKRMRKIIANQTKEDHELSKERMRERAAETRAKETAEKRTARLEKARLRTKQWLTQRKQRLRSAALHLLRSQQNDRDRLIMAERCQQKTQDQPQQRLCAQNSSNYKLLISPKIQHSRSKNNRYQQLPSDNIKPKLKLQKKFQKQEKGSDSGGTTKSSVGPYVQCKGRKDSLKLCKVINVKDCSDADHISSGPAKCGVLPSEACKPQGSSRVSENVPWKCVFCSRGTSHMFMGDLFGPYFPQQQLLSSNSSLSSLSNVNSKKSLLKTEKGSSTTQQFSSSSQLLPNGLPAEMWVHCDCAVWTNGIFVAGGRLLGLEEAALTAQHSMCCKCRGKGATLGCFVKGCELKYHYLCACDAGCTLQEENFSILCPKHKTRPVRTRKTTVSNQEPPVVLL